MALTPLLSLMVVTAAFATAVVVPSASAHDICVFGDNCDGNDCGGSQGIVLHYGEDGNTCFAFNQSLAQ